jgi:hypothetical protein
VVWVDRWCFALLAKLGADRVAGAQRNQSKRWRHLQGRRHSPLLLVERVKRMKQASFPCCAKIRDASGLGNQRRDRTLSPGLQLLILCPSRRVGSPASSSSLPVADLVAFCSLRLGGCLLLPPCAVPVLCVAACALSFLLCFALLCFFFANCSVLACGLRPGLCFWFC